MKKTNKTENMNKIDYVMATADFKGDFEKYTVIECNNFNFDEYTYLVEKYVENQDKMDKDIFRIRLSCYFEQFKDEHYDEIIDKFGDVLGTEGWVFQELVWERLKCKNGMELYKQYIDLYYRKSEEAAEKFKQYQVMKNYEQYL